MKKGNSKVTEEYLLQIYMDCWNTMDTTILAEYIDEYVTYDSHWVFASLVGKTNFLEYFNGKLKTIKNNPTSLSLSAEMKICSNHFGVFNKPCLLLFQISDTSVLEVTLFIEVKNEKIVKIEMCEAQSTYN
jgi:hypothetical protein